MYVHVPLNLQVKFHVGMQNEEESVADAGFRAPHPLRETSVLTDQVSGLRICSGFLDQEVVLPVRPKP